MAEIPPISPRFTPHPSPGRNRTSTSSSQGNVKNSSEIQQHEAERELQGKLSDMHEQVQEAQRQTIQRIDEVKDQYNRQIGVEDQRSSDQLEATRSKGYERVRDLQRTQQAELARVRRDGEKELGQAKEYYRHSIDNAMTRGEEELTQVTQGKTRQLEYETAMATSELDLTREEHQKRVNEVRSSQDQGFSELTENSRAEFERAKETSNEARSVAHQTFQKTYKEELDQQSNSLNRLNANASQKIKEVRADTSRKLAAYEKRQTDPFYQMLNVGAQLSDEGDAFVLTAKIPRHEQRNISVAVRGDQFVLSGYRRSQEKVELEPGHTQSTSAYQAFTEALPLPGPVDAKAIQREFDGDMLLVYVPKKQGYGMSKTFKAKDPERIRIERPKFPENIATVEEDKKPRDPDTGEVVPSPSRHGSKTLI